MVIVPPSSTALFLASAVRKNVPQPCQRFSQIGHVLRGKRIASYTRNRAIRPFPGRCNRRVLVYIYALAACPLIMS